MGYPEFKQAPIPKDELKEIETFAEAKSIGEQLKPALSHVETRQQIVGQLELFRSLGEDFSPDTSFNSLAQNTSLEPAIREQMERMERLRQNFSPSNGIDFYGKMLDYLEGNISVVKLFSS